MQKRLTLLFLTCALLFVSQSMPQSSSVVSANERQPIKAELGWIAEYYNNTTWDGEPALVRGEETIDYRWDGSPGTGVDEDFFSVRWQGDIYLEQAGTLHLYAELDDRMRVLVNENEIIDNRTAGSIVRADTELEPGWNNITVQYVEYAQVAIAKLEMEFTPAPPASELPWYAQYYDNTTFDGPPLLTEFVDAIAYDWGEAAPKPSVPADFFGVRWSRTETNTTPMTYAFTVSADDAIRILVNDSLILNNTQPWTTETVDITLDAGTHDIVVEYLEYAAYAYANVAIERVEVSIDPGPWPVLQSFTVDKPEASFDEAVTLNWSVLNASEVWIRPATMSDPLLFMGPYAAQDSLTFDMSRFCDNDGQVLFALEAGNASYALTPLGTVYVNTQQFDWFFWLVDSPQPGLSPCQPARTSAAAQQRFEGGWMLWIDETDTIYVFYDSDEYGNQSWQQFPDTFDDEADIAATDVTPPEGLQEPLRGFGKVWRGNERVRELLGWATEREQGFTSTYQGRIDYYGSRFGSLDYFTNRDGNLFALSANSSAGPSHFWSIEPISWR